MRMGWDVLFGRTINAPQGCGSHSDEDVGNEKKWFRVGVGEERVFDMRGG